MSITINKQRLADYFTTLCETSSPSREEKQVVDYLRQTFAALGADFIHVDDSAATTESDTGNLIVRFTGSTQAPPIFFACHMDTVNPGHNVRVKRDGDIFTSKGDTVLGGDDKSGIAPLIELVTLLKENKTSHRTIELVFTTCEEIGLLGAKSLDYRQLKATFGYALDSTGIDKIIVAAPAANKIRIDIHGTASHAGLNPEAGVNALLIAAHAITKLRIGRVDDESTANIGVIEGGIATNIVPEHLYLKGEVRSHSMAKLDDYTEEMRRHFVDTAADWPIPPESGARRPTVTFTVESDYPAMRLDETDQVLETARAAARKLERPLSFVIGGGGSDANIFNSFGLATAILATGMNEVHTTDECLDLNDMVKLTELLYAIATE
jgi:tripeptide aminopeptidase